jgi:hypothetical protein
MRLAAFLILAFVASAMAGMRMRGDESRQRL